MTNLQKETLAARARTGKLIAVSVNQGAYRVEEIIPKGRTSDVIPLSEPGSIAAAVEFLRAMEGPVENYTAAVEMLTDDELGAEICSKQRIQMKCRPDSADWQRASKLLSVFFAEAKIRSENGSVIQSL